MRRQYQTLEIEVIETIYTHPLLAGSVAVGGLDGFDGDGGGFTGGSADAPPLDVMELINPQSKLFIH